jgi:soluble lytic murein transglycosylase-like protein
LIRRLYRTIVVGYFGLLLLGGSALQAYQEYEPDEVLEEEIIIDEVAEVSDELLDMPSIMASWYEERTIENEDLVVDDPYYYDISDGYISEDSLVSCCKYVGNEFGIDPALLMAFAKTESNYYVYAVGTCNDSGLCQIVPKYNRDRIERLGVNDIFDPIQNLSVCADLIKTLEKDAYGYDIRYIAMAYNMGQMNGKAAYEAGRISKYAQKIETNYYEVRYLYE